MSSSVDVIPKTYEEAVRTLVGWHADDGALPDLEIYSFPDPDQLEVRLLEVSDQFPRTERPWGPTFGRSDLFPFKSTVVQIPPAQWAEVQQGTTPLPRAWDLERRQRVWP